MPPYSSFFPNNFDLLLTNASIATMAEGKYNCLSKSALGIKEGKIAWLGSQDDLPDDPGNLASRTLDCKDKWILPGFVDCHTHLVWAGSRAEEFELRLEGASYEDIAGRGGGIFSTVTACRRASEDHLFSISKKRTDTFLGQGTTCLEIKSGYGLDLDTELKILAVIDRLKKACPQHIEATFLGAHALPPEFKGRSHEYVDLVIENMLPRIKDSALAEAVDVFCEKIAFSREQTRKVFEAAQNLGFRVKLHAEQLSDSDGAALAADFNALSCDHLEYLSESGAKKMAEKNIPAVLLPGAFYFLRETKLPPVALLRELGIPMAVSTDLNPGTSPVHSMLPVLNMACILFGLTCEEAIAGATINGAKALNLDHAKGSIEPGKDADLVIWDIGSPADLCYIVGNNPIEQVVISGEIAYTRPGESELNS